MLSAMADHLHTHARRVLLAAVALAIVAGLFGAGVSKHLSPYGANDPATQSVQATNRFQAATGRKMRTAMPRQTRHRWTPGAGGYVRRRSHQVKR
jgi:hypothetical protein